MATSIISSLLKNSFYKKIQKIHRKTPGMECWKPGPELAIFSKKASIEGVICEFCETFESNLFTDQI